ncbi:MAG: O-antigen ligase family protein [Pirellulaceae bacterium]|nr:O-antigen ligase family protein [Pirellulaceae bacterium]
MTRKQATSPSGPAVHSTTSHPRVSWTNPVQLLISAVAGVLVTSLLITGDSVSVYDGDTLPQVLLILLTGLLAGWTGQAFLPLLSGSRLSRVLFWLLISLLLVSCLAASWRADGRAAWNGFWHVLSLMIFGLITRQLTHQAALVRALTQLLIAMAVFQSTFALHQYAISMPEARAAYMRDPDRELAKANIDAPPGSEIRSQYESRLLGSFEPTGTFALTNTLAVLLSGVIVALGLSLIVNDRDQPKELRPRFSRLAFGLMVLSLALIVIAWLLTKSRSGYLSVVLVGLLAGAMRTVCRQPRTRQPHENTKPSTPGHDPSEVMHAGRSSATALVAVVSGIVAVVVLAGSVMLLAGDALVLSEAPKSIAFRLEYWQAASRMIVDYPWTGVGLGNFQSYYPQYKVPLASEIIADPHNWLFDLAACCSAPALIIVLFGLSALLLRSRSGWKHSDSEPGQRPSDSDAGAQNLWPQSVWIGAGVGFVLTAAMQWLVQEILDIEATVLSLMVSGVALWSLLSLRPTLATMRSMALLAVVAMLICLLISGSWQASGIALPMATWLAICSPGATTASAARLLKADHAIMQPTNESKFGLLIMLIALVAFWWQTWRPVHNSWTFEQNAMSQLVQGNFSAAQDSARASIAADSLSQSPRVLLVQILTTDAQQATQFNSDKVAFQERVDEIEQAVQALLTCDSVSYLNWNLAGESVLGLAATAKRAGFSDDIVRDLVTRAAEYYAQAAQRYPSSVAIHAQNAVVLAWLNRSGAPNSEPGLSQDRELQEVYALSDATPHTNRQLAAQQVWLPPPLDAFFPGETIVRPVPGSPWVKAEPLCDFLRNN